LDIAVSCSCWLNCDAACAGGEERRQGGGGGGPRTVVPSTGPLCHLCSSSAARLPRPERAPVNDAQTISNAIPATSR